MKFRRIAKQMGNIPADKASSTYFDTADIGVLHERRKKVGVHVVSYVYHSHAGQMSRSLSSSLGDEVVQSRPLSYTEVDYVDTSDNPQCAFLFKYRPKGMLFSRNNCS